MILPGDLLRTVHEIPIHPMIVAAKFLKNRPAWKRWVKKNCIIIPEHVREPLKFPCYAIGIEGDYLYKEDIDKMQAMFIIDSHNSPL